MGDGCAPGPPLLREAEYSVGIYSQVVSVMERLAASMDARPSTRLTLSGMCVYVSVNASDSHLYGSVRGNESERVKEGEDGYDHERLVHEDVPSEEILRSKEVGYASASVNESGSVRLNVSEGVISELGNETVND